MKAEVTATAEGAKRKPFEKQQEQFSTCYVRSISRTVSRPDPPNTEGEIVPRLGLPVAECDPPSTKYHRQKRTDEIVFLPRND